MVGSLFSSSLFKQLEKSQFSSKISAKNGVAVFRKNATIGCFACSVA